MEDNESFDKNDDATNSLGYKMGEVFAYFILGCAMLSISAITLAFTVKFINWIF